MSDLPPAARLYVRVTAVAMSLYVLVLIDQVARATLDMGVPLPILQATTITCCVGVAAHVWSLLRLVQQSDEFMRTVMARRLLIAAMIVIGGSAILGLFQSIGLDVRAPLHVIYIGYFVVHAALIPLINADRP